MRIVAKIKFGSGKQRIESFGMVSGAARYLVYIMSKIEEPDSMDEFNALIAKELGVPPSKIEYLGKQGENHVFNVD